MAEQNELVVYEDGDGRLQLRPDIENQTIWATYAQVAALFGTTEDNVLHHLKNLYDEGDLDKAATTEKFSVVQIEGGRQVTREVKHINLDAIIEVGYRVRSRKATRFRQWATQAIKELIVQGVVVDEEKLAKNPEAQRKLGTLLRAIRLGEQEMYQKVKEVFKGAASDYDGNSPAAKRFFAMAQDKFHYAATLHTAAQLILERADGTKPNMGLATFRGEHPTLDDAKIGKNYLTEDELQVLENLCDQFILFAESKAMRGLTMTMEELQFKLNSLLTFNEYPVLYEYPRETRPQADAFAKKQLAIYNARLKAARAAKQIGS